MPTLPPAFSLANVPLRSPQVVFSRRAHAAIVAETFEQHPNETGGVLLGHARDGVWTVIEAIDPGPAARFSPVTFEYDTAYVNHLARKVAGCYRRPLRLIGLWHRHPGSFDRFSPEDDDTNRLFAILSPEGALSCLVNLDPIFRITAYHVPHDLAYRRLCHHCSDQAISPALLELRQTTCLDPAVLENRLQQKAVQALLAGAHSCGGMSDLSPTLAAVMEPLLQLLENQKRYVYGLRLQGDQITLALVERRGTRQHCFRLYAGAGHELRIAPAGSAESVPYTPERLLHVLEEPCHG